MVYTQKKILALLAFCFGLTCVLPTDMAEAGIGSVLRKAAKKTDDGAGSIGYKLDVDGLKHFDVEPGTSRFGLTTNTDGSINVKSTNGKELNIRSGDDLEGALASFQKSLNKSSSGKASFFVSPDDLFHSSKSTKLLAKIKGLHVITGTKTSLPVSRIVGQNGAMHWGVEVRKGMIAATRDVGGFSQALFRMNHAFNPADIHVVSFSKKAPDFPDAINLAARGHVPDPTLINPVKLEGAFKALRGKKLIVSGKVEGDVLLVKTSTGVERLPLRDLRAQARQANIDLIVLGGKSATQPGKRALFGLNNDKRLAAAFSSERYGDFLTALGGRKRPMVMRLDAAGENHVIWRSVPPKPDSTPGLMERIEGQSIVGEIAQAAVQAGLKSVREKDEPSFSVELNVKNKHWQKELDGRIISLIPVGVQILLIVNLIAGLLAWATSSWLWEKIWRLSDRSTFSSKWSWFGYRLGRNLVMIFTLMALFGFLLFLVQWTISAWQTLLIILRFVAWPFRKLFEMLRFLTVRS